MESERVGRHRPTFKNPSAKDDVDDHDDDKEALYSFRICKPGVGPSKL